MDDLSSNTRGIVCSTLFLIIAVLAVLGNIFVILTICVRKTMRSALNYLIASIALADILQAIFSMALRPIYFMRVNWPLGNIGCKLTHMFNTTTSTVVIITLATISTVLFKLIVCPSQKPLTKHQGVKILVAIWLISIFVGLPNWIFAHIGNHWTENVVCFYDRFMDSQYHNVDTLNLIVFTICTTVPAVWLIVTYIIILCKGFRSYSLIGRKHDEIDDHKFNKTMVIIMILIAAVHLICWGIHTSIILHLKLSNAMLVSEDMYTLIDWMTVTNTVFRPVIYIVISAKFRSNMLETIACQKSG